MKKVNILIVEDNLDNVDTYLDILEDKYNCFVTNSGDEAIELLNNTKDDISIILLDIMMPGKNGFQTISEIRKEKQHYDIPVIFVSARNDSISKLKSVTLGGDDYIVKPFEEEELLSKIENRLSRYFKLKQSKVQNKVYQDFFINIFSHEVRLRIGAVYGNLQLIKMELDKLKKHSVIQTNDEQKTYVIPQDIYDTKINAMNTMIEKSLNECDKLPDMVNKIVHGFENFVKVKINKDNIMLKELIDYSIKTYNNPTLNIAYSEKFIDAVVECDTKMITDVLLIIFSNAVIHNYEDSKKVEISSEIDNNRIIIAVSDNGNGIPLDKQEVIFKNFGIAHNFMHHNQGLGLGLSIAKNYIYAHNEEIWFETGDNKGYKNNKGTTFYFSLSLLNQ